MGSQTVTILVQSVIILLAVGIAGFGWRRVFYVEQDLRISREEARRARSENGSLRQQILDLTDVNTNLRQQLAQIPLAPKPKKVEDSVIRAKSPAMVRQLTEREWGLKPGEQDERAS